MVGYFGIELAVSQSHIPAKSSDSKSSQLLDSTAGKDCKYRGDARSPGKRVLLCAYWPIEVADQK